MDINITGLIKSDYLFVRNIYKKYLLRVDTEKEMLREKYGLDILLLKHPGVDANNKKNSIIARIKSRVSQLLRTVSF